MKLSASTTSSSNHAEEKIRELAREHGISGSRQSIDDWIDKTAELSGQDDGRADEVEQLLINMRRAKVIDPVYARELFGEYLNAKLGYK
jgi:hypothetical protein